MIALAEEFVDDIGSGEILIETSHIEEREIIEFQAINLEVVEAAEVVIDIEGFENATVLLGAALNLSVDVFVVRDISEITVGEVFEDEFFELVCGGFVIEITINTAVGGGGEGVEVIGVVEIFKIVGQIVDHTRIGVDNVMREVVVEVEFGDAVARDHVVGGDVASVVGLVGAVLEDDFDFGNAVWRGGGEIGDEITVGVDGGDVLDLFGGDVRGQGGFVALFDDFIVFIVWSQGHNVVVSSEIVGVEIVFGFEGGAGNFFNLEVGRVVVRSVAIEAPNVGAETGLFEERFIDLVFGDGFDVGFVAFGDFLAFIGEIIVFTGSAIEAVDKWATAAAISVKITAKDVETNVMFGDKGAAGEATSNVIAAALVIGDFGVIIFKSDVTGSGAYERSHVVPGGAERASGIAIFDIAGIHHTNKTAGLLSVSNIDRYIQGGTFANVSVSSGADKAATLANGVIVRKIMHDYAVDRGAIGFVSQATKAAGIGQINVVED